jgi:hypothetical protein
MSFRSFSFPFHFISLDVNRQLTLGLHLVPLSLPNGRIRRELVILALDALEQLVDLAPEAGRRARHDVFRLGELARGLDGGLRC